MLAVYVVHVTSIDETFAYRQQRDGIHLCGYQRRSCSRGDPRVQRRRTGRVQLRRRQSRKKHAGRMEVGWLQVRFWFEIIVKELYFFGSFSPKECTRYKRSYPHSRPDLVEFTSTGRWLFRVCLCPERVERQIADGEKEANEIEIQCRYGNRKRACKCVVRR